MQKKRCPKCNDFKDFSKFYKDKSRKLGITSLCKECLLKKAKEDEYKKKRKEYNRKTYLINREKICEEKRLYYQRNKEKIKERHKKYYNKNKVKILAKKRAKKIENFKPELSKQESSKLNRIEKQNLLAKEIEQYLLKKYNLTK